MLKRAAQTVLGIAELLRLAAITGFRFRGAYWRWRFQTAIGPGERPPRADIIRRLIRYGAWSRKMRTGRW